MIQEYLDNLLDRVDKLRDEEQYERAIRLYENGIRVCENQGEEKHPYYTFMLNNAAFIYKKIGNYERAENLYKKSLKTNERLFGREHENYIKDLEYMSTCYSEAGKYKEAEETQKECLKLKEKVFGKDHHKYASGLNDLANIYAKTGRYKEALQLFKKSLGEIKRAHGKNHWHYIVGLNNLGSIYLRMDQYKEAEEQYQNSLALAKATLGEKDYRYAMGLHNLGYTYYQMGKYDKAKELLERSMDINKEISGENDPYYGMNLNNLAMIYDELGEYSKAKNFYKKSLDIKEKIMGKNHPDYAITLSNMGVIYSKMEDYERAREIHEQAAEITKNTQGEENLEYIISLKNILTIYLILDRIDDALDICEKILDIENKIIRDTLTALPENQRLIFLEKFKYSLDMYLSQIGLYHPIPSELIKRAFDNVLYRKGIGTEVMMIHKSSLLSKKYPKLRKEIQSLNSVRQEIAQITLGGDKEYTSLEEYQQCLSDLHKMKDELESKLSRTIPEFEFENQLGRVNINNLADKLHSNSVLIEIIKYDAFGVDDRETYMVFILHGKDPNSLQMTCLGKADCIDELINEYRKALIEGKENICELGKELRELVFDDFKENLDGKTHIIISPDGELTKLPFEILSLDKGYLLDKYSITYINTARDLLRNNNKDNSKPSEPVIIADPIYDIKEKNNIDNSGDKKDSEAFKRRSRSLNRDKLNLSRLPFTRIEGELIGEKLGQEAIMGEKVLEGSIREIKGPRVVRIATHGFFLENQESDQDRRGLDFVGERISDSRADMITNLENPLLRSGLALTGAKTWLEGGRLPKEAEDGLLTAEDVTTLDLSGTDLVVLSACETGLGELKTGEGVYGLRRAFVLAGAKNLVMSLWSVDDLATSILMERFYENIVEARLSYGDALREAQRYLRNLKVGGMRSKWLSDEMINKVPQDYRELLEDLQVQGNDFKPFEDPYYWGGFICQGYEVNN